MIQVEVRHEARRSKVYDDGSVDSSLTESAAHMLRSVEAYLAEHPGLDGVGRIPPAREGTAVSALKMRA